MCPRLKILPMCLIYVSCSLIPLAVGILRADTSTLTIFQDDFSDRIADGWQAPGWQIEREGDGNFVFSGQRDYCCSSPSVSPLDDFSMEVRFKLRLEESGSFNLIFRRQSSQGQTVCNYSASVFTGGDIYLKKLLAGNRTELARNRFPVTVNSWMKMRIVVLGPAIKVYLNEFLVFDFRDGADPILHGYVDFQALAHVHVDDVVIQSITTTYDQKTPWVFLGGPRGGMGYDVSFNSRNPDIIWVTDTSAGAHRSLDGGLTWKTSNFGIRARVGEGVPVFCLTMDRTNPSVIWAGLRGIKGVYKTIDGGITWQAKSNGIPDLPNMEFRSFTIDPRNSDIIYTGGNYTPSGAAPRVRGFIFKTTDGGENWTQVLDSGALVRWIIIDPRDSRVIYAATGIFFTPTPFPCRPGLHSET